MRKLFDSFIAILKPLPRFIPVGVVTPTLIQASTPSRMSILRVNFPYISQNSSLLSKSHRAPREIFLSVQEIPPDVKPSILNRGSSPCVR